MTDFVTAFAFEQLEKWSVWWFVHYDCGMRQVNETCHCGCTHSCFHVSLQDGFYLSGYERVTCLGDGYWTSASL
jgi:hypothetical protein